MSWIKEQLKRQQEEKSRAAPPTDVDRNGVFLRNLPLAWKRLVDTMSSDIATYNAQSERQAVTRVTDSQIDIRVGKTGAMLVVNFDPEKYQISCSLPGESVKKFKFMMDPDGEYYMWGEGEGQITFERVSEVLLTPLLFP